MVKSISIDWLQISVLTTCKLSETKHYTYSFKLWEYGTKLFEEIYTVKKNGIEIGTIQAKPRPKHMNPQLLLIKYSNNLLYSNELKEVNTELGELLKWKFNRVNRLDLAIDFHEFDNKVSPVSLIREIMSSNLTVRGSKKLTCIIGDSSLMNYQYLKAGSNKSEVSWYLYNKTVEMREVALKPWIVENWEKNNLDLKKDIWRLEFRIIPKSKKEFEFVDLDSGEVFDLFSCMNDFLSQKVMAIVEKHFRIYQDNGTKNKSRINDIRFFEREDFRLVRTPLRPASKIRKWEKSVVNSLLDNAQELRNLKRQTRESIAEFAISYINENRLYTWATEKDILSKIEDLQSWRGILRFPEERVGNELL